MDEALGLVQFHARQVPYRCFPPQALFHLTFTANLKSRFSFFFSHSDFYSYSYVAFGEVNTCRLIQLTSSSIRIWTQVSWTQSPHAFCCFHAIFSSVHSVCFCCTLEVQPIESVQAWRLTLQGGEAPSQHAGNMDFHSQYWVEYVESWTSTTAFLPGPLCCSSLGVLDLHVRCSPDSCEAASSCPCFHGCSHHLPSQPEPGLLPFLVQDTVSCLRSPPICLDGQREEALRAELPFHLSVISLPGSTASLQWKFFIPFYLYSKDAKVGARGWRMGKCSNWNFQLEPSS